MKLDLTIFQRIYKAQEEEEKVVLTPSDKLLLLARKKIVWPALYSAVRKCLTVGVSTATVEASFSTLTRLMRPNRLSMTADRKLGLCMLAHNRDITQKLDLDVLVTQFSKEKNRRLPLGLFV